MAKGKNVLCTVAKCPLVFSFARKVFIILETPRACESLRCVPREEDLNAR